LLYLKPYLRLLRPGTLLPPLCGGLLFGLMGVSVSNEVVTLEVFLRLCLSGFLLACTNGISNIINQVHDMELDRLTPHKKNRPIASGEVSVDEALSIVVIVMVFILGCAWFFFPFFYALGLSMILIFCWMYNSPPLRLKVRLFWSNLAIAAPRGALGIITAYSAFAYPFDSRILLPALALGIYVYGANTLKDYEDCEPDREMGIRNFCTVYGKEKASEIVIPFLGLPFLVFVLGESFLVLLALPVSLAMVRMLYKYPDLKGRGILMWKLFYFQFALMMLLYVLPYL